MLKSMNNFYATFVYIGFDMWNNNKCAVNMESSNSGNVMLELDFNRDSFVSLFLISSFWLIVY